MRPLALPGAGEAEQPRGIDHREMQGDVLGAQCVLGLAGEVSFMLHLYLRELQDPRVCGMGGAQSLSPQDPAQLGWGVAFSNTEQPWNLAFLGENGQALFQNLQGFGREMQRERESTRSSCGRLAVSFLPPSQELVGISLSFLDPMTWFHQG